MAISRRTEKRAVKIIGIATLIVCLCFFGSIGLYLAMLWFDVQVNTAKIQFALDQTCGAGVVQVDTDSFNWEFGDYDSAQADCLSDGVGGYTCECYTPTPANP
jgi:hypothetical protein